MNIGCKICKNRAGNTTFTAREMLRGTREQFNYLECSVCRSVQLLDVPEDMSNYYDNQSYGSFADVKRSAFIDFMRRQRNRYAIRHQGGLLGKVLSGMQPLPLDFTIVGGYASDASKILDVGCGAGSYVRDLISVGFVNSHGIDPFIRQDIIYPNGATIKKLYIDDVEETYDIILSHHSLEHVPDPLGTLKAIRNKLAPRDGICILTVPVAEDLYRRYRENCYLIQAPQHFFLFSIDSVLMLIEQAGLSTERIMREAETNLEWFKTSELWSQNVSSNEPVFEHDMILTKEKVVEFKNEIGRMKNEKIGDNVVFIIRNQN